MVEERRQLPRPLPLRAASTLATWLAALIAVAGNAPAHAADDVIRLCEAAEQGTFNVGPASAVVRRVTDLTAGGDVLKLDYTIPPGTAAGIYAKSFPGGLSADRVDVAQLAAKAASPEQRDQIVLVVEIKGSAGVQRIPLPIHPDWAPVEEIVNWPAIGTLSEVVVSVSPTPQSGSAKGSIAIDIRFKRLSILRKLGMSPWARFGGVFLASLVGWLLASLLRSAAFPWPGREPTSESEALPGQSVPAETTWPRWLLRDLVKGAGAVFIAVLAMAIDLLGEKGPLEAGWTALGIAIAGAAIAEWWKFGLTRRHLTAAEVFQDMLATGLLAASASPLAILQAPAAWSELFLLSQTVAAVGAIVYHAANAHRLASSGRHLGAAGAAILIGTPYVIGGLTLLESDGLLQALGGTLTAGALASRPEALAFVGRVVVIFCFNEAVANGLGLATKRAPLKSLRAHVSLVVVAIAAISAPWVASLGSGATVASWPAGMRLFATIVTTVLSQAGLWAEAYLITGLAMDAIHGQAPSRDSCVSTLCEGWPRGWSSAGPSWAYCTSSASSRICRSSALPRPVIRCPPPRYSGPWRSPCSRRSSRRLTAVMRSSGGSVGVTPARSSTFEARRSGWAWDMGSSWRSRRRRSPMRAWFGFGFGALAYAGIDLVRDAWAATRDRGRVQPARLYFVHALLGGFIGAAIGFYFDATQVSVVAAKFHRYLAAGVAPETFDVYPLVSKWGYINLVTVTGGVSSVVRRGLGRCDQVVHRRLALRDQPDLHDGVFPEGGDTDPDALHGERASSAWREHDRGAPLGPVDVADHQVLPPADGRADLVQPGRGGPHRDRDHSGRKARAPRHSASGACRFSSPCSPTTAVRILIWLDHMGLRVATLVNLSFLGMDKLEQRLARFLAPAATARCIPEGVKRFTTWAPLLDPVLHPPRRGLGSRLERSRGHSTS